MFPSAKFKVENMSQQPKTTQMPKQSQSHSGRPAGRRSELNLIYLSGAATAFRSGFDSSALFVQMPRIFRNISPNEPSPGSLRPIPLRSQKIIPAATPKNIRFAQRSGCPRPAKRSAVRYVKQELSKSPVRNAVANRCWIETNEKNRRQIRSPRVHITNI